MTLPSLAQRTSAAAHAALPHANPLAAEQLDGLLDALADTQPATALDVGCGPGTASIGLAARCPVRVTAFDISELFLERARRTLATTTLRGEVALVHGDRSGFDGRAFDAVLCLGASQAVGTPREALAWCRDALTPRGAMLFAELTWRSAPDPAFLGFLGTPESWYWREASETEVFAELGLRIDRVERASPESWRAYETGVDLGRRSFAAQLPPEEAAEVLSRADAWTAAYERYGARCLGFSAYIASRAEG